MKTLLKSTTSLVLCLSLATPGLAQDAAQGAPFPCVAPNGETAGDAAALAAALNAGGEQAAAEGAVVCGPEAIAAADAVAAEDAAADQAAADQAAADQAAADQAAADQAAADQAAADQAAADQAAADQAAADQAAAAEAAAEPETDDAAAEDVTEAAPETAQTEDAPMSDADAAAAAIAAQAETEGEAEATPEADAETGEAMAEDATTEDAATEDATTEDTATDDTAAADAAAAEAAIAGAAGDDAAADAGADAATDADAEADAEAPAAADVDVNVETEATAEATVEGEAPSAEAQADRTAELEAERQNAAAAAAAAALAAGTALDGDAPEVVTEDVTEDDVRNADEDFENRINDIREADADSSDDEGLSNFEKALVLGLGAVVVGSLLRNGDEVVSNSGDRVIVERDGQLRVLKNDDVLLRQPGAQVGTQTFDDGSTLTTVTRDDGSVVTTIRAADGTVLRRSLTQTDGTQVALIDDLGTASPPVVVANLPPVPTERVSSRSVALNDQAALETALTASLLANTGRTYSLEQVRGIREVRALAPQIDLDAITFETGSAAIPPSQAEQLAALGGAIRQIVASNPQAIFLVEGHTDAVGDAGYNLGLSDRRAETVALALSQYFSVPPENLVTQGYGEQFLRVQSLGDERANRRASVRNITQLLRS